MQRPLFAVALLLVGCNADISSELDPEDDNYEALCAPTGRSMVNTGVYIGPDGCEEVTLYIIDEEDPTYWLLAVSWPMYGEYKPLDLENLTSGDSMSDYIYSRDPEFTLYAGDYLLGGLEVMEGLNEFSYTLWDFIGPQDNEELEIVEEGTFELEVLLEG